MRHPDMQTAISCLASLFENGELMASTDPVQFIDDAYSEITALRARVAELGAWAAKAEAVRVAAWGHITTWPDDDPDPVATARLRTALSSCPPLGSVNDPACRHGEGKP